MSAQGVKIVVVGIGADGWAGLGEPARAAIRAADEVFGSPRQLATLPDGLPPVTAWPSPLIPALDALCARPAGNVCIVASGDPLLHGIGASVAARVGIGRLTVVPFASAFAYACARLGWPTADAELVSAVARPAEVVARALQPARRVVVYVSGAGGAAAVARVLLARGLEDSRFVVLERLGGADERITDTTAGEWGDREADPLHCVAIQVAAADRAYARTPGLPDAAFAHDGALTKRHVRAVTLAALAPRPGALLWDVGAGSGSIAIEWLRAEATARAIAVEPRAERAERILANALALGVPSTPVEAAGTAAAVAAPGSLPLRVVLGTAPEALAGLPRPDAVFVGGGLTAPGMLDACWEALRSGGRFLANAVTLESEQILVAAKARHGGTLTRIEISHAEPIGAFTGWRAQMPVVQWECVKPR